MRRKCAFWFGKQSKSNGFIGLSSFWSSSTHLPSPWNITINLHGCQNSCVSSTLNFFYKWLIVCTSSSTYYIPLELVEKNLVKCYQLLILAVKVMPRRFQGTRPCHVSVIETFLKFMSKKTRPSSGRVIFMVNLTRPTIGLWKYAPLFKRKTFLPNSNNFDVQ